MVDNILLNDDNLSRFYEIGLQVNSKFDKLFDLSTIIANKYEYLFGYYEENNLKGFIHVSKLYETLDIVNIVVDMKYRKKGIGNKLISFIIHYFDDVKQILLEVNENNYEAINLYTVNNFKVINRRDHYYGKDAALIMKRDVENERC